jgi:CubicO group peptidase (beta-lactamase class C family)
LEAADYSQVFPSRQWETRRPAEMGFDETSLKKILPTYGIGGVIIRHGYLVASWGNPEVSLQTASMGKAFTGTVLGLAVDAELVKLDDLVWKTWTGEGELSHPYKYLNAGQHAKITWRHLVTMTAGFLDIEVFTPALAIAAGGEMGDIAWNYARRPPGERFEYSDAGMWRFSQALTKLWHRDIRDVLDEKIFTALGISRDRWDWMPGKVVHDYQLYPELPGYGEYLDPPYEIDGHIVRGGPGWVVINANDLARFGYLMLRRGRWRDKQLLSEAWTSQIGKPRARMTAQLDYGLNWWVYRGGKAFAARGISVGWAGISSLWVIPDYDLVIAFIRSNVHVHSQQEAYEKNNWDEGDWPFQVAETIVHPER